MREHAPGPVWDEEAGPLVRPYTLTGGRTRSAETRLDMISTVVASRREVGRPLPQPEHARLLGLCRSPVSVAELAGRMDVPIAVVKVLLGDLIAAGFVFARTPPPLAQPPETHILQAVLDGIRRL